MQRLAQATVVGIVEERSSLQIVDVVLMDSREKCQALYYSAKAEPCLIGERVLVNTTAVRLGLGTGGYHLVVSKLAEAEVDYQPSSWGHLVKMRYSPMQVSVPAVEEEASPYHHLFAGNSSVETLQHTPVLIGELHSLLPVICLAVQQIAKERSASLRVVYVMPDSASLTSAISRHVYHLRGSGALAATITTGHAWGGDQEAINIYTGLLAARHVEKADIIVCLLGPGVAGTATKLGFSGMQLVEVIHAVAMLAGVPFFVPRISFSDSRDRHYGISHHTSTVLSRYTLIPVLVPLPLFNDCAKAELLDHQLAKNGIRTRHEVLTRPAPALSELLFLQKNYPLPIESMGRGIAIDPSPFQAAYCAAQYAALLGVANASGEAFLGAVLPPETLAPYYADWLNRAT